MSAVGRPVLIRGRAARTVLLLPTLAAVLLGGCAGGDFGRTRRDFVTDDMHRWIGAEATGSIGLQASAFQLTDQERNMRDMAYPLIEAPHARPAWKSVFGDYQPIAAPWRQQPPFDRTAYGKLLIDEPHRSHSSRYNELIQDVRNDLTMIEPFQFTAARVLELDQKRNASLKYIADLSPNERADAVARMEENSLIVQWVQQCLRRRASSYRWALERLVIMAPDGIAADADRLIAELELQAANLGQLAKPAAPQSGAVVRKG
ncbi:hypothetical protein KQX63_09375 [Rhodopseudomonas palustris]|uniref:hypothetical protein n=1 Tax=Rhodopseudomonas TaxID=1073 RepID=UPI000D1AF7F7|nr:hypothetical protein [Rhodopseudomonas palustris]AVT75907.1 hypothetical protein RPPS3_18440 [Rhodopseudomonas palustris]UYO46194.1 hypothetical protein KQX63_09375 [Rhodopseudomonas palustris]UYO55662.1 hypothetical protein KQX61_09785 [Rhodopseudomonas palustris]